MKTKLLTLFVCLLTATTIVAQDENLKMQFDFSNVSSKEVTDPVSGIKATMVGSAQVQKLGKFQVLDLGKSSGYLNMTAEAGKLLASLADYSISVYYRVSDQASLSGNGYFLWAFSTSTACGATSGAYTAYRLNAQRIASTTGGYQNEKGYSVGSASPQGEWIHVAFTQTGTTGRLYINGKLQNTTAGMPANATLFGTTKPSYCWIGRAPFSGDSYLAQTLVSDFRLYDAALTADQIAKLAIKTTELNDAYNNGGGGDNTALNSLVEQAEALLSDTEGYPQSAITALSDITTVAKAVAAVDHTQDIYDQYGKDLQATINSFKAAKGFVFDTPEDGDAYSTDRGFKHPGGLHTKADFERIKRQLAEGNAKVTNAYNILKNAEYAQPGVATWPVETIVRGGGSGQNYLNAARGATMAYQNGLRWQIEGNRSCAAGAVRILMQWARTCKLVSGDSNWALAAGLYGYQFAQAAELVRDYDGWSEEEFNEFKQWMLTVWYPGNINFLRGRNGTWENYVGNQGGIRPGHYWSNWPLCNALAVISIGVLCDDVFIYNQGMSFMKYDQVGTFKDPRPTDLILNDGCTEFIGNFVVTTFDSELETGAYGKLGQIQESGRDGGHSSMALGLAVDICKVAWNQGDDLFSYMDNRMAAGIEFLAACTQNVKNLPWTNYKYVDCRTAWHNGWLMTGPAEPAEVRPYWGTVIGHYEGVKGVKMPFSEKAYSQMGTDAGGMGGTSGGYDHLGYSVLTNTYDTQLCPEDKRPTLLSPKMEYDGKVIEHNELGGLRNTYVVQSTNTVPAGKTVKLMPQLPEGAADTGNWKWNTGETTKDITVSTDRSFIYRVTYTNENGIESEQMFSIAVEGDCTPSRTNQSIYVGSTWMGTDEATVFYGDNVTLNASDAAGWWTAVQWDNGQKGNNITVNGITSDRTIQAYIVNQGGGKELVSYTIHVKTVEPRIIQNGTTLENQHSLMAKEGDAVVLQPYVPVAAGEVTYKWDDGSASAFFQIPAVETSSVHTVEVTIGELTQTMTFEVFVEGEANVKLEPGYYLIHHIPTDTYLTANGKSEDVTFTAGDPDVFTPAQTWEASLTSARHAFTAVADSTGLSLNGTTIGSSLKVFYLEQAKGLERYSMHTGTSTSKKYWDVDEDGTLIITQQDAADGYPFEFIPVSVPTAIETISNDHIEKGRTEIYDLQGRRLNAIPQRGIYILNGKKYIK